MNFSNLHLLIIWSSALEKKDYILEDLKSHFSNIRVFKVHWDSNLFFENYQTFYAHSLKHLNPKQFGSVIRNKINHCGASDFIAIVFEDLHPKMEMRETSNGVHMVNVNVFDKKTEYRQITGGGHRIHSSDNPWETNKDLTLLFGLNAEDFAKKYSSPQKEDIFINQNCLGVGGYNSIHQLFYVLNNTINYCVLRNFECLPDEYTVEGHGDIDLLVEDNKYMSYLTLAKPIFHESYRVYHTIKIAGTDVPFDFRFVGDNYYDKPWEEQILKNRQLKKDLFYTPSNEDLFYSLLYHAYIQKHDVKPDYLPKLNEYGKLNNVVFHPNLEDAIGLLDNYLRKKSFEFIRPKDLSVVYNRSNLQLSKYALRFGDFIKRVNENGDNGYEYTSLVYKKKDSYIKRGTDWLIENEERFLKKLAPHPYFPKLIDLKKENGITLIEISQIEGYESFRFFKDVNHQRKNYIKSFLKESISILTILNQNNICHRDFLPSNLIVKEEKGKCKVGLIDFGWAIYNEEKNIKNPKHLGGVYKPEQSYSDVFTFGKMLMEIWYDVPYIRNLVKILTKETHTVEEQKVIIDKANQFLKNHLFTPYDEARLFIRRHQRANILKNRLIRLFR